MRGHYITCGLVVSEEEIGLAELSDGIARDFAEICEDFTPHESENYE